MNTNAFGVSKADNRSSGSPSVGRRLTHHVAPVAHTLAVSPKGRRFKNFAREQTSSAIGSAPGVAVGATGAGLFARNFVRASREGALETEEGMKAFQRMPHNRRAVGLMLAGAPIAYGGAKAAQQINLGRMQRKGYLKAESKKVEKSNTLSAFGVDHNEEISKLSFKPITQGFKALKLGNAKTLPKTMGQSYKSGIASGQGKFNSGVNAAAVGVKHSPGIAAAGAGLGVAGVGGAGYAMGRRKD